MKWTVTYRPSAEKDLANVWMNAVDRDAVAHAADEIDRILGSTPLEVGEAPGGLSPDHYCNGRSRSFTKSSPMTFKSAFMPFPIGDGSKSERRT